MSGQRETRISDLRQVSVTVAQAAEILRMGAPQVRKALDREIVTAAYTTRGRRQVRTLDGIDLVCLRLRDTLRPAVRQRLYDRLKNAPPRETLKQAFHLAGGEGPAVPAPIWIYDLATETLEDVASLKERTHLVGEDGKLSGTTVEAARIAALVAGGMTTEAILLDYPNVTRQQIDAAVTYVRTHPKPGRPFPARTVKSVSRDGGGGGLAAAFALSRSDEAEGPSESP